MNRTSPTRGFTAIELLVTLVVVAITFAFGVPGLRDMIRSNRILTEGNSLIGALNLARSEAVKRGVTVSLCKCTKDPTGTVCTNVCNNDGNWEDGWLVFSDVNGDGAFTDNGTAPPCEASEDCLIRVFDPLPSPLTLRTGGTFKCWLSYLPTGATRGSGTSCSGNGLGNDTFRLCQGSDTATSRSIVVNNMGRAMSQTGASPCP